MSPSMRVVLTEAHMALAQLDRLKEEGFEPQSVGADKGYHQGPFVEGCRDYPHGS